MKNFIVSVVLTLALIVFFSCLGYCPEETEKAHGAGTQHKGGTGLIVPGDGELLAEAVIQPEQEPAPERPEAKPGEETSQACQATSEEPTNEIKEERNKMDGMLIAFWHGVAAVLIGETGALMVALAWMKIRNREK